MTKNAERFSGRIEEYERYRIRYPREMLSLLRERCGLSKTHVVADVGAGTGMLAELFLENGNPVAAIEPNAEMRAVCMRLKEQYPQLSTVDATAEVTTLQNASVDFVTAGRAFHWFDQDKAMKEFRRVLLPHGWVVLAANGRSQGNSEQQMEYERILTDEGVDHRDVQSRYRIHDTVASLFAIGTVIHEQWHGEQTLTLEEFLGQTQSYSAVPLQGHPKYHGMQRALRNYFDRFQHDGLLRIATTCYVTCGQFSTR
jgi:ubiquinone/menaquinone biosynthesis C-methylase UbiE